MNHTFLAFVNSIFTFPLIAISLWCLLQVTVLPNSITLDLTAFRQNCAKLQFANYFHQISSIVAYHLYKCENSDVYKINCNGPRMDSCGTTQLIKVIRSTRIFYKKVSIPVSVRNEYFYQKP